MLLTSAKRYILHGPIRFQWLG